MFVVVVVVVVVVGWEVGDAIVAGCPAGLDETLAASWRRARRCSHVDVGRVGCCVRVMR